MQGNQVLKSVYTPENVSEKYLSIFYRKSRARRTLNAQQHILRKFGVHTAEQAEVFESMFEIAFDKPQGMFRKQFPTLSVNERVILAFMRIGIPEAKISRNMGMTIEEQRRHLFLMSKKLQTSVLHLRESIHKIVQ